MTPLNAALALATPADVDVELPVDGPARDLHLELLGDVGLVERAAAAGAAGHGALANRQAQTPGANQVPPVLVGCLQGFKVSHVREDKWTLGTSRIHHGNLERCFNSIPVNRPICGLRASHLLEDFIGP